MYSNYMGQKRPEAQSGNTVVFRAYSLMEQLNWGAQPIVVMGPITSNVTAPSDLCFLKEHGSKQVNRCYSN